MYKKTLVLPQHLVTFVSQVPSVNIRTVPQIAQGGSSLAACIPDSVQHRELFPWETETDFLCSSAACILDIVQH